MADRRDVSLVAVFIADHEYDNIFGSPITLNFGGHYLYSFELQEDDLFVSRTRNENHISDFFNLTNSASKLKNVSAIVGQNGAGKTTLLNVLRSAFVRHEYSLPSNRSLFLYENDKGEVILGRNDFVNVALEEGETISPIEKTLGPTFRTVKSLYYAPHIDLRVNPNFDDIDDHDISLDQALEDDLKEYDRLESDGSGWHFSPKEELLFRNAQRQTEFLASDLVKKQDVFRKLFLLPEYTRVQLVFRGYNELEREWDTPYVFRTPLKSIANRVEKENRIWNTLWKLDKKDRVTNQHEINAFLLKREVLTKTLNLIYRVTEVRNQYLTNASFRDKEFQGVIDNVEQTDGTPSFSSNGAFRLLIAFLDCAYLGDDFDEKGFDSASAKRMIEKIYVTADSITDEKYIDKDRFHCTPEDANEILNYQREFINDLRTYYHKRRTAFKQEVHKDLLSIRGFVNFRPFNQTLSSGENALINFYSRLFEFVQNNFFNDLKAKESYGHYILLIDEGELTFHPLWKKKYVLALCKTLPYFFELFPSKPTFQIIFTTHDSLTLSDLPNSNVSYIQRESYDSMSTTLDFGDSNRPARTFAANISDLMADSFFIGDTLTGDFATMKIQEVIKWLNRKGKGTKKLAAKYEKTIRMIDEPIVGQKLAQMFDEKRGTGKEFQKQVIDRQMEYLKRLRENLGK